MYSLTFLEINDRDKFSADAENVHALCKYVATLNMRGIALMEYNLENFFDFYDCAISFTSPAFLKRQPSPMGDDMEKDDAWEFGIYLLIVTNTIRADEYDIFFNSLLKYPGLVCKLIENNCHVNDDVKRVMAKVIPLLVVIDPDARSSIIEAVEASGVITISKSLPLINDYTTSKFNFEWNECADELTTSALYEFISSPSSATYPAEALFVAFDIVSRLASTLSRTVTLAEIKSKTPTGMFVKDVCTAGVITGLMFYSPIEDEYTNTPPYKLIGDVIKYFKVKLSQDMKRPYYFYNHILALAKSKNYRASNLIKKIMPMLYDNSGSIKYYQFRCAYLTLQDPPLFVSENISDALACGCECFDENEVV